MATFGFSVFFFFAWTSRPKQVDVRGVFLGSATPEELQDSGGAMMCNGQVSWIFMVI